MEEDISPRLEQKILGPRKALEISTDEFLILINARKTLVDALAFEQRYELLLGNYLDFESTMSRLSLSIKMGVDYTTYISSANVLLEANRLLVNLMTSARAYGDQVKQDFKHLNLDKAFKELAEELLSREYDDHFEYRFMEALRNHVQHKDLPASRYGFETGLHESLKVSSTKESLEGTQFKAKVLEEMPEHVELRSCSYRYVECLSKVHAKLRKTVAHKVDEARQIAENAIDQFKDINDGKALGLHAHRRINGKDEWIGLMVEWDDVRMHLARKNEYPLNFDRERER